MKTKTYGLILLILLFAANPHQTKANDKVKIYTSLKQALKHPERVHVLDLRGQKLDSLPKEIGLMINLEVLLLNPKLRNLLFYPRSWKYKLGFKHLPAGGFAHLQGRRAGIYFYFNNLSEFPPEICNLKNLKLINICNSGIDGADWTMKLKENNPDAIILTSNVKDWKEYEKEYEKAKVVYLKFGIDN